MTLPAVRTRRSRRMAGPTVALGVVASAWLAVAAARPGDTGPGLTLCPWRLVTGLDCPFCGATRAAASLAHGDLVTALDHNALFVLVILPLAVAAWGAWTARAWRAQPAPNITSRSLQFLIAVTLGWWVLRLAVPWFGSAGG